MANIQLYKRLQLNFDPGFAVDKMIYTLPDGSEETGPVFEFLPAKRQLDHHGYEKMLYRGGKHMAARFTPDQIGKYKWRAIRGDKAVSGGEFFGVAGDHHGYVQVSDADGRYFEYTDGVGYVPVGLCLVGPDTYFMPASNEHFEQSQVSVTPGIVSYRRWFRALRDNGANFARLWLSNQYFNARTEIPGRHDGMALSRLDGVVEEARACGIKLKLCLEHFRSFDPSKPQWFYKKVRDPATGEVLTDIEKWFDDPRWDKIWLADVKPYLSRYWNDPVVFAWELWNENDCGDAGFDAVMNWTNRMLPEIKKLSPKTMVTNSLGSYDEEWKQSRQDAFRDSEHFDFNQVHRYLDQGAPWEITTLDPVEFSKQAIEGCRRMDKPIILAETGAVNDRHTGPFRFYNNDHRGLIFTDVTYTPLFVGAAGSGHMWHWHEYVETKNLWQLYKPMTELIAGIDMMSEEFEPFDLSDEEAYILGLDGKRHMLLFVRNKSSRWDYILRDAKQPVCVEKRIKACKGSVSTWWLCMEENQPAQLCGDILSIPRFDYGCVIRIDK